MFCCGLRWHSSSRSVWKCMPLFRENRDPVIRGGGCYFPYSYSSFGALTRSRRVCRYATEMNKTPWAALHVPHGGDPVLFEGWGVSPGVCRPLLCFLKIMKCVRQEVRVTAPRRHTRQRPHNQHHGHPNAHTFLPARISGQGSCCWLLAHAAGGLGVRLAARRTAQVFFFSGGSV